MRERPTRERAVYLRMVMNGILGYNVIADKSRKRMSVWGRNMLAYQLFREGASEYEIADFVRKNHSSVHYMKERMREILDYPFGYKEEIKVWKRFQKEITK